MYMPIGKSMQNAQSRSRGRKVQRIGSRSLERQGGKGKAFSLPLTGFGQEVSRTGTEGLGWTLGKAILNFRSRRQGPWSIGKSIGHAWFSARDLGNGKCRKVHHGIKASTRQTLGTNGFFWFAFGLVCFCQWEPLLGVRLHMGN